MRRSHAIAKKHAFLCVFSRPAKISKWRHFRSYRRFAVMFEQAELRGTQVGPNGPPNAKKNGLNRPRNRYSRKPGLLVMSQKRPFGPFWPVISEAGWTSRKKCHLESGLNHRDEAKSAAPPIKSFVKATNFFCVLGCVSVTSPKGPVFWNIDFWGDLRRSCCIRRTSRAHLGAL